MTPKIPGTLSPGAFDLIAKKTVTESARKSMVSIYLSGVISTGWRGTGVIPTYRTSEIYLYMRPPEFCVVWMYRYGIRRGVLLAVELHTRDGVGTVNGGVILSGTGLRLTSPPHCKNYRQYS